MLIGQWKPWERSTGPRTPEGKARVSCNTDNGDTRGMLRELARLLRDADDRDLFEVYKEMERLIDATAPAIARR